MGQNLPDVTGMTSLTAPGGRRPLEPPRRATMTLAYNTPPAPAYRDQPDPRGLLAVVQVRRRHPALDVRDRFDRRGVDAVEQGEIGAHVVTQADRGTRLA